MAYTWNDRSTYLGQWKNSSTLRNKNIMNIRNIFIISNIQSTYLFRLIKFRF